MSRSVPILPPPSDRPFLTVEEAAAVLGISRTLAYSLAREFLTTRAGLPCVRLGSRASSFREPPWSAGRTRILRTRTTQRDPPETANRSTCRRHRPGDHRRDPCCRSARLGGAHPPLRITERRQPIRDRVYADAGHRPWSQQGHLRSSPSDPSLFRPHRCRHHSYRAWPLRHDPLPTARPAQAHTYTDDPGPRRRATAANSTVETSSPAHRTLRAADAARLRLTDMSAHSRRQQPNSTKKPHELASPMAARLLPSAVPGPVRPCPVNRDTESYAC